jgi:hypothetical protein
MGSKVIEGGVLNLQEDFAIVKIKNRTRVLKCEQIKLCKTDDAKNGGLKTNTLVYIFKIITEIE